MKSFQFFDIYDYLIFISLTLIAIIFSIFYIRRCNKRLSAKPSKSFITIGMINLIIGLIVGIGSVVDYISIEERHNKLTGLLQHLSIMTSEPLVILSIIFFLIGLVLLSIGTIYLLKSIKVRSIQSWETNTVEIS
jgi:hypothetical protein